MPQGAQRGSMDDEQKNVAEEQESSEQNIDTSVESDSARANSDPANLADTYFEDRPVDEPSRKSGWISNLFFVAVIVLSLVLMYQLSLNAANGSEKTLKQIFANLNVEYFCVAVATVIVMIFVDSMKYFLIMRATVGRQKYVTALKVGILGKYYDNITPFSSGGQPFQIYYLHKKGLSGGQSTAVIFIKFCFNMLMWLAICFCLMLFNRSALTTYVTDTTQRRLFGVLGWIGFSFNLLIPLTIIAFVIFPKVMETVTRWVLTLAHKMKIIKSEDALVLRARRVSKDFRNAFVVMWKKPFHAILLMLCCFVEPLLSMMLPYFVVVAFVGNAVVPSWELMFAIMTLHVYVSMSVAVVPTPGNSGAMENAFLLVLTSVAEGVLFWTVFTWRFFSYYTYVIIGLIIVIADFVRRNRAKN